MPAKVDNVQKLLAAEEKRNKMVSDAKQKKQARVKQARADAERDVASFKGEKEGELEKFAKEQLSGSDGEKVVLERETERTLVELNKLADARIDSVADAMVNLICSVPK